MTSRIKLPVVCLTIVCFQTLPAAALDFMGPPAAQLNKGKWSIGAEYTSGEMVFKAKGLANLYRPPSWDWPSIRATHVHWMRIDGFDTRKTYATVGYGLTDSWDVITSLGTVKSNWSHIRQTVQGGWRYRDEHEESHDLGLSLGLRKTLYTKGKLRLGALAKYSRLEMDDAWFHLYTRAPITPRTLAISAELVLDEVQVAAGGTYDLNKNLSIYGGPFFHWLDGKLRNPYIPLSPSWLGTYTAYGPYNLRRQQEFGAYIGGQMRPRKNMSFNIEYQHVGSADCVGMSLLWRCK